MAKKIIKRGMGAKKSPSLNHNLAAEMERSHLVADEVARALSEIALAQYPGAKFWQPRQMRGLAAVISRHAHGFGLELANLEQLSDKHRA